MKKLCVILCFVAGTMGLKAEEMSVAKADSLLQPVEDILQAMDVCNLSEFSKLSEYQVLALEHMYNTKKRWENPYPTYPTSVIDVVKETIVPIFFFILCGIAIFLIFHYNWKDKTIRYRLLEKSIEKGVELPHNVLIRNKQNKKERDVFFYLKIGIIFAAITLPFFAMGIVLDKHDGSLVCIMLSALFGALAIGYLLIAFLEKSKEKQVKSNEENR